MTLISSKKIKVVEVSLLAHLHIIFFFILKRYDCFRAYGVCGSRVVHNLYNKTMPKRSAKLWKRGGARQPPRSPPLVYIHTWWLLYFQVKIELYIIVWSVLAYFCPHRPNVNFRTCTLAYLDKLLADTFILTFFLYRWPPWPVKKKKAFRRAIPRMLTRRKAPTKT